MELSGAAAADIRLDAGRTGQETWARLLCVIIIILCKAPQQVGAKIITKKNIKYMVKTLFKKNRKLYYENAHL